MGENPNTWFTDTIHFEELGESVAYEEAMLKTYDNFETYFPSDVVRLRAVTYSESPEMLLDVFDGGIDEMEVIVGDNTLDYRERLRGKEETAARLERLHRAGKLTIHLTGHGGSDLHSKLYLLDHEDGSRTTIQTSANLSKNGWSSTRQKNIATIYRSSGDLQFDAIQDEKYAAHKSYAKEFMADLTEEVAALPDDQRRERVYAFIDGRQTNQSEMAEFQNTLNEQLDNPNVDRVQVLGDWEDDDVDVTVAFADESDANVKIRPSLAGFDGLADDLRQSTRHLDNVRIGSQQAEMPAGVASQHSIETFGNAKAWRSERDDKLVLQKPDGRQIELQREWDDPAVMNQSLAYVEEYVENVDEHGRTNAPEAVKAQMMEALLWFFWSPFSSDYAAHYREEGIDLDKFIPDLYLFGETNSGKGSLGKYAISLLSDGAVVGLMDGDGLGKRKLRAARSSGSRFPIVFDDIDPRKVNNETYLNFREKHFDADGATIPSLAFISNDELPEPRVQNRMKTLHLPVQFDDITAQARYINTLIERPNPVAQLFAHEFDQRPVAVPDDSDDTLVEARRVLGDMYEFAGRSEPPYLPLAAPAEREYDTGKQVWQTAVDAGNVRFEQKGGNLIATFDDDFSTFNARTYARSLPNQLRADPQGRTVVIQEMDAAREWFPFEPLNAGLLTRLFGRT
jgi:hypothetical protein